MPYASEFPALDLHRSGVEEMMLSVVAAMVGGNACCDERGFCVAPRRTPPYVERRHVPLLLVWGTFLMARGD